MQKFLKLGVRRRQPGSANKKCMKLLVYPKELRFSKPKISHRLPNGISIYWELFWWMLFYFTPFLEFKLPDSPPMKVVRQKGQLHAMDNQQLWVLKNLWFEVQVPVEVSEGGTATGAVHYDGVKVDQSLWLTLWESLMVLSLWLFLTTAFSICFYLIHVCVGSMGLKAVFAYQTWLLLWLLRFNFTDLLGDGGLLMRMTLTPSAVLCLIFCSQVNPKLLCIVVPVLGVNWFNPEYFDKQSHKSLPFFALVVTGFVLDLLGRMERGASKNLRFTYFHKTVSGPLNKRIEDYTLLEYGWTWLYIAFVLTVGYCWVYLVEELREKQKEHLLYVVVSLDLIICSYLL